MGGVEGRRKSIDAMKEEEKDPKSKKKRRGSNLKILPVEANPVVVAAVLGGRLDS